MTNHEEISTCVLRLRNHLLHLLMRKYDELKDNKHAYFGKAPPSSLFHQQQHPPCKNWRGLLEILNDIRLKKKKSGTVHLERYESTG